MDDIGILSRTVAAGEVVVIVADRGGPAVPRQSVGQRQVHLALQAMVVDVDVGLARVEQFYHILLHFDAGWRQRQGEGGYLLLCAAVLEGAYLEVDGGIPQVEECLPVARDVEGRAGQPHVVSVEQVAAFGVDVDLRSLGVLVEAEVAVDGPRGEVGGQGQVVAVVGPSVAVCLQVALAVVALEVAELQVSRPFISFGIAHNGAVALGVGGLLHRPGKVAEQRVGVRGDAVVAGSKIIFYIAEESSGVGGRCAVDVRAAVALLNHHAVVAGHGVGVAYQSAHGVAAGEGSAGGAGRHCQEVLGVANDAAHVDLVAAAPDLARRGAAFHGYDLVGHGGVP